MIEYVIFYRNKTETHFVGNHWTHTIHVTTYAYIYEWKTPFTSFVIVHRCRHQRHHHQQHRSLGSCRKWCDKRHVKLTVWFWWFVFRISSAISFILRPLPPLAHLILSASQHEHWTRFMRNKHPRVDWRKSTYHEIWNECSGEKEDERERESDDELRVYRCWKSNCQLAINFPCSALLSHTFCVSRSRVSLSPPLCHLTQTQSCRHHLTVCNEFSKVRLQVCSVNLILSSALRMEISKTL